MKKLLKTCFIILIIISLASCGGGKEDIVYAPAGADEMIGRYYETVVSEFQDAGFTNIQIAVIEDLTSTEAIRDGRIDTILIDDVDNFIVNDEFSSDAKVSISYHTTKKVSTALSSRNIQDKTVEELSQSFVEAGFIDVNIKEEYDLDPDITDNEYENEISINGISTFSVGDRFPFDAEVLVICHYPYEKYTVKMHVDFVPNFIFSRYDVDFSIDDTEQEILEHGEDADFEFRLKEGKHTFVFSNVDSLDVKGETEINVTCDVEASYKIYCYSDKVNIETVFVDFNNELAENEAKIMCTESNFRGKDYQEVMATLKEVGFTNIKTIPKYDIYFGITQPRSTDSVKINGSSDFKRGDVFLKNSEIIISYHMPYEDNPENQTNETPSSSLKPDDLSVAYSTNDRETAKNGNSGIFAYKSIGGTYDNYWIIDFDEGYVYSFSEGNSNGICDRLKMDSGDLNSVLIVTYHDGSDVWSYGLHFKWENQPDKMILQDNDGFEYTFLTTDLDNALEIRDSKTIIDY